LTAEGRREAHLAGAAMAGRGIAPDLVLCSTALRTRQTLSGVLSELTPNPEVRFLSELFGRGDYQEIVRAQAGGAATVLVVGHNPFIQETTLELADAGADEPERRFPPSAFAVLTSPGGWSGIRETGMRLGEFVLP
jgi:phosphohistidine phosphatase